MMDRQAQLKRIAELQVKVALLEHEAGVGDSLKTFFVDYIKNPTMKLVELPQKLWGQPLEELFDITVKHLAPEMTKVIREAQIELHVEEWKAGFDARQQELTFSEGYAELDLKPSKGNEDWNAGYMYYEENRGETWGPRLQKKVVEQGLREWDDLVGQTVVSTKISDILHALNPIELIKHIVHAVKKYGIKTALPIVIMEVVLHSMPVWASKFIGPAKAAALSQIPITELLTPAYLKWISGAESSEDAPGYLDWYEEEFGQQKLAHTRVASRRTPTHNRVRQASNRRNALR